MSSSLTVFRELRSEYTTWPALQTFLTSAEGGCLRVVTSKEDATLVIVRYVKGVSDFSKAHVASFRSVVWNTETNLPVSVAPVKAQPGEPVLGTPLRITDFVDGVMIQAWHGTDTGSTLATRTSIGARGNFYSQRSFAELLEDALAPVGGTTSFLTSVLAPGQFLSLVLQHPEHKTVAEIAAPRLYVTGVGNVGNDGLVTMTSDPSQWHQRLAAYAVALYEPSHVFKDSAAAGAMLHRYALGHTWQGLVFQEAGSVRRWRMRNPAYVLVRTLRGAEASQAARFLRLRSQGQIKEYVGYFREESAMMWALEQTLRSRTQGLYDAYTNLHKAKSATMRDLPLVYRPHVYAIHGQYMARFTAGQKPAPVLKETVIAYVNALAAEDQRALIERPLVVGPVGHVAPVAPVGSLAPVGAEV